MNVQWKRKRRGEKGKEPSLAKRSTRKINRCIVWQWYLFAAITVSRSALTTCTQTRSGASTRTVCECTLLSRITEYQKTCYFKLSDSEWIFNQMNILFTYHLMRSNYFWAMDNFNHFHTIFVQFSCIVYSSPRCKGITPPSIAFIWIVLSSNFLFLQQRTYKCKRKSHFI